MAAAAATNVWVALQDAKTGKTYFTNHATNQTAWALPAGAVLAKPAVKPKQVAVPASKPAPVFAVAATDTSSVVVGQDFNAQQSVVSAGVGYYFTRDKYICVHNDTKDRQIQVRTANNPNQVVVTSSEVGGAVSKDGLNFNQKKDGQLVIQKTQAQSVRPGVPSKIFLDGDKVYVSVAYFSKSTNKWGLVYVDKLMVHGNQLHIGLDLLADCKNFVATF